MDMYNGVKAMIEAEKALPDIHATSLDKRPTFPENCKSLLKKHLTEDIWNRLKDVKD